MEEASATPAPLEMEQLKRRLAEAEQLIEAIRLGEVDAFAIGSGNKPEIYTLQSGDYAYRILVEEFGEGALNITEEGLIVYTNRHFFELIRLPYDSIIGTYIYDYIHPDSIAVFKQLFQTALHGKSKGELILSVNGLILPVYMSLTSLQPNLATVGVIVSDLTEKKKHEELVRRYQSNLEEKNIALVQSNTELASFAYIASHDLQEPLRKIQTFASRILEKEAMHFQPETKDYFVRIGSAAQRMQSLIVALLEYSRVTDTEDAMSPTDLNDVVSEVRANLAESIAECGAVISSSELPALQGIPYQLTQVFTNLISNALKYCKPDIAPSIRITARQVGHDGLRGVQNPKPGQYWEIVVADNGIGFDAKYAGKIFDLFQRLHRKGEYEGTGIGLAICRKVLQNHGGYITAEGQPGAGAAFYLYFPLTTHYGTVNNFTGG